MGRQSQHCSICARFYLCPVGLASIPHVFVNLCFQGRSSHWSHWEAEDPNPNCQKGTGYVSLNSLLSGEVTMMKVAYGQCGLLGCIFSLQVAAFLTITATPILSFMR